MPPKSINELEGRTTNFSTEMKREQSLKKKSRTSKKCGIIQKNVTYSYLEEKREIMKQNAYLQDTRLIYKSPLISYMLSRKN